jgi:hypothetical protein
MRGATGESQKEKETKRRGESGFWELARAPRKLARRRLLYSTLSGHDAIEGVVAPQGRALLGDNARIEAAEGWRALPTVGMLRRLPGA